jgi:hypothetical protein
MSNSYMMIGGYQAPPVAISTASNSLKTNNGNDPRHC